MKFFQRVVLVIILGTTLFFSGCKKDVDGKLTMGEVALTFDDYNIDNWYKNLPLLDSLEIKATFYVCRYHDLTADQKKKLHEIASHGNEIAYHTTNHRDMVKVLKSSGMAPVINDEIEKDLHQMRADGFDIRDFAYPFGSHNRELDCAMKRYFRTVRKVCNTRNWNKSLVKQAGEKQILYGAGIDQGSKLSEQGIIDLLENAKNNHDCVVLTAHELNNPRYSFSINTQRLIEIQQEAAKRNLKFITVDQIVQ